MINEDYKLTFGVEVEAILVFHESLILGQLRKLEGKTPNPNGELLTPMEILMNLPYLKKDIPIVHRRQLNDRIQDEYKESRPLYKSWGVTRAHHTQQLQAVRDGKQTQLPPGHERAIWSGLSCRTYGTEPLHLAKEILRSKFQNDIVKYWKGEYPSDIEIDVHESHVKPKTFSHWHLNNDFSLEALDRGALRNYLLANKVYVPSKKRSTLARNERVLRPRIPVTDEWDSYGIELVSPPLPINSASFDTISSLLRRLRGFPRSYHGATTTDYTGLHIHLAPAPTCIPGLPPPTPTFDTPSPTFDLPTMTHLAYLLVMYEPHIDTLHAPHRRTTHPTSPNPKIDIKTNRRAFLHFPPGERPDETRIPSTRTESILKLRHPLGSSVIRLVEKPLADVRRTLFKEDMTWEELAVLMGGDKGRVVNFTYLARGAEQGPRTVEFRQHEGCLEGSMVRWWTLFCVGLVRLASWHARDDPEGLEYKWVERNEGMSVWDLFEEMQFPEEGIEYFSGVSAYYASAYGRMDERGQMELRKEYVEGKKRANGVEEEYTVTRLRGGRGSEEKKDENLLWLKKKGKIVWGGPDWDVIHILEGNERIPELSGLGKHLLASLSRLAVTRYDTDHWEPWAAGRAEELAELAGLINGVCCLEEKLHMATGEVGDSAEQLQGYAVAAQIGEEVGYIAGLEAETIAESLGVHLNDVLEEVDDLADDSDDQESLALSDLTASKTDSSGPEPNLRVDDFDKSNKPDILRELAGDAASDEMSWDVSEEVSRGIVEGIVEDIHGNGYTAAVEEATWLSNNLNVDMGIERDDEEYAWDWENGQYADNPTVGGGSEDDSLLSESSIDDFDGDLVPGMSEGDPRTFDPKASWQQDLDNRNTTDDNEDYNTQMMQSSTTVNVEPDVESPSPGTRPDLMVYSDSNSTTTYVEGVHTQDRTPSRASHCSSLEMVEKAMAITSVGVSVSELVPEQLEKEVEAAPRKRRSGSFDSLFDVSDEEMGNRGDEEEDHKSEEENDDGNEEKRVNESEDDRNDESDNEDPHERDDENDNDKSDAEISDKGSAFDFEKDESS